MNEPTVIKPNQKIGILTATATSFTPKLLNNCNVTDHNNLVVRGLENAKNFSVIIKNQGCFDNGMAQQEVVDAALSLFEDEGDIGAILLECSDMPPYAAAVQEATQLPVFDFITLIKWLHNATAQRPYSGWI